MVVGASLRDALCVRGRDAPGVATRGWPRRATPTTPNHVATSLINIGLN